MERETVAVRLGPDTTVTIPLTDAIAEYLRLAAFTERPLNEGEIRIFAALTLAMGTLNTTYYASGVNEPLRDAVAQ